MTELTPHWIEMDLVDGSQQSLDDSPSKAGWTPPRRITVNQLKNWSRCRAKYGYETVKNLGWPTDATKFQFGQDIHKLLDYQARELPVDHILSDQSEEMQLAWEAFVNHPLTHWPVVASEWGFWIPCEFGNLSHTWLVGRLDRLSRNPDNGHVVIVDWKTGTGVPKDPAEDWQTKVYGLAVWQARDALGLNDLQPDQLEFVYVEWVGNDIREYWVSFDQAKLDRCQEELETMVCDMVDAQEFPLPRRCPDPFCAYRGICGIQEKTGAQ